MIVAYEAKAAKVAMKRIGRANFFNMQGIRPYHSFITEQGRRVQQKQHPLKHIPLKLFGMPKAPQPAVVVLCTVSSLEEGRRLARELVDQRLAACVNLIPKVESIYRWQGAVESAEEAMLMVKTTPARFAELQDKIAELHFYDVPEILALPVTAGSAPYLEWLAGQV
jgi:periplasmic divalent cation tolerance protein